MVGGMFGAGKLPIISAEFVYQLKNYAVVLLIAIVAATPVLKILRKKAEKRIKNAAIIDVAETAILVVLLIVSTGYLADGSFNPFLYFRF